MAPKFRVETREQTGLFDPISYKLVTGRLATEEMYLNLAIHRVICNKKKKFTIMTLTKIKRGRKKSHFSNKLGNHPLKAWHLHDH